MTIECPNGHSREFKGLGGYSTLMAWERRYDANGKEISRDPNIHTQGYQCKDCGVMFERKTQYGEVISVSAFNK